MRIKTFHSIAYFFVIILALGLIFIANGSVFAWDPPSQTPPNANVPAPINVSTTAQIKLGDLSIGSGLNYWLTKLGDSFALKNNAGEIKFILGQDGNVGIGTINATNKLFILADTGQGLTIGRDGTGEDEKSKINFKYGTDAYWVGKIEAIERSGGGGDLYFYSASNQNEPSSPLLVLKQSGLAGINTDTPTTQLDINGQIRIRGGSPAANKVLTSIDTSGLATWQTAGGGDDMDWKKSGNNIYTAWTNTEGYPTGNVGIGQTSPTYKLDVNGKTRTTCLNLGGVEKCKWPTIEAAYKDSGWQEYSGTDLPKNIYAQASCNDLGSGYVRTGCSGLWESDGLYWKTYGFYVEPYADATGTGCKATLMGMRGAPKNPGMGRLMVYAYCARPVY